MIIDQKQIQELARKGVKLTTSDGKHVRIETPRKQETELDQLRTITSLLSQLLAKPDQPHTVRPPDVIVNPPEITVKPPDVIVNNPPAKPSTPIRKWKFELIRGFQGLTTEIIATAME